MMSAPLTIDTEDRMLKIAAAIVEGYVSNNPVPVSDLPAMIRSVHATLMGLSSGVAGDTASALKPAVPIKKSVTPDHIVCLEDGAKLKMLKRYLRSRHDLSPEEYRAKWHLPADYPMVAPNYAKFRSEFAKKSGLGRNPNAHKRRKRT